MHRTLTSFTCMLECLVLNGNRLGGSWSGMLTPSLHLTTSWIAMWNSDRVNWPSWSKSLNSQIFSNKNDLKKKKRNIFAHGMLTLPRTSIGRPLFKRYFNSKSSILCSKSVFLQLKWVRFIPVWLCCQAACCSSAVTDQTFCRNQYAPKPFQIQIKSKKSKVYRPVLVLWQWSFLLWCTSGHLEI